MSIIRNRILAHRRQSFILNYNKKTALNATIVDYDNRKYIVAHRAKNNDFKDWFSN